ncbi:MAG: histidine kinase N-terminal 7TM domain-containing protein [Anaerolineae bacterium]
MDQITVEGGLAFANLVVSAANVILAFSLLVYLITHNWRSPVARATVALLGFVSVVHAADVVTYNVLTPEDRFTWLRFQWLGIAFIPAAYLHFSDAIHRAAQPESRWRQGLVVAGYLGGALLFLLVVFSDLVVRDGVGGPWVAHFRAGPLFWVFSLYFLLATFWGVLTLAQARSRTLNPTSRRRMTYLAVSFAAPALGAFPYMLVANLASYMPVPLILGLTLVGGAGVSFMTVVMAYSVAFHGALTPDRVVRRGLVNYLLRGPFVGLCLLVLMLVISRMERILGLPRDTVLILAVVVGIVVLQGAISALSPLIDLIVYRRDRAEIAWIRALEERLMTTGDLKSFLEDILTALCDLLEVRNGFVMTLHGEEFRVEAISGSADAVRGHLATLDPAAAASLAEREVSDGWRPTADGSAYWLVPLWSKSGATLGYLGVESQDWKPVPEEVARRVEMLVEQAGTALEDRMLQQGIFSVLRRVAPDVRPRPAWGDVGQVALEESPVPSPEFSRAVKEALSHYWGGPNLAASPLLRLGVVRRFLSQNENLPVQALRAVLLSAIEALKPPESQRSLASKDWILYNILEMKFIRGWRMKEIAQRLALSESDLYRKQRVAVDSVAQALTQMEAEATPRSAEERAVDGGAASPEPRVRGAEGRSAAEEPVPGSGPAEPLRIGRDG